MNIYQQALGFTEDEAREWTAYCAEKERQMKKRHGGRPVSSADVVREAFAMARRGE